MDRRYLDFLERKAHLSIGDGFDPITVPDFLFDFQKFLVEWSVKAGRCALFADCGMGKTPMQLVWADNVVRKTNKPVLILTPLSVSCQTIEEAKKFGINAARSSDGRMPSGTKIVVTNYERLHYFDWKSFAEGGVVCDESSIMKNFDGIRKSEITEFMKKVRYRLLCTATAAPNDYIEYGTSSEALGYLGYMDMLSMFFKNDENSLHPAFVGTKWRFKSHAEDSFWRWLASWARACRKPSDFGFNDGPFVLPPLNEITHKIESKVPKGKLFSLPARSLLDQRRDTRSTLTARCELAADLCNSREGSSIVWCHLNSEADLLCKLIDGAEQVSGSDDDSRKEEVFDAFRKGTLKKLVTKPKIAAFGMNWQHCSHEVYFPTHSYEQYYQSIRRCWRFGQTRSVDVDLIISKAQELVLANMLRKSEACDRMFTKLIEKMLHAMALNRMDKFDAKEKMPKWL